MSIEERLANWRPSMGEYHAYPGITSGLLLDSMRYGLSHAMERRKASRSASPYMARGAMLHAALSGDTSHRTMSTERSKALANAEAWGHVPEGSARDATPASMADVEISEESIRSLCALDGFEDTDAKREIRTYYGWPGMPEVSHRWEPTWEDPTQPGETVQSGLVCQIREDMIVKTPRGGWVALPIKTGARPLGELRRRLWREHRSRFAFYRAGLRDLFAGQHFDHRLIVASLTPPYAWGVYDLEQRADELDGLWDELVAGPGGLAEIREAFMAGRLHGREELSSFESAI